ncbi:MAG: AMP-dependent synthetase/ligase [Fimbriimonadaceae bacterium]
MARPDASAPTSLGALLRNSCRTFAERTAWLVPRDGGFEKVSYRELFELVRRWASGVRSLGLSRGDRLCILSENCAEWALLDWACQTLGIVVVPIYPTLPAEQASYIVGNCAAKVVVCGDSKQLLKVEALGGVRSLLLRDGERSMARLSSEAALLTDDAWNASIDQANPEDVATIIYTSGTTGLPKGAMLAHRNFIWMNGAIAGNFGVDHNDTFLSFLPLSHVLERANGHFLPIGLGATIAYSRSLASLASDIVAVRPTILLCVPRFLEATMARIKEAVKKEGGAKLKLFNLALAQGERRAHGKVAPLWPLLNRIVGAKIRARLGGRMRFLVSGGAALPRHVYDFYTAFGIKLVQGYGLTETTSAFAVNNPLKPIAVDTVGQIFNGAECRIAEDGEIIVRGPAIMLGYYNEPDETMAALDAEGWFHTGDIGVFEGENLKITDRKKDLLVLGNGKNVAPQPIENRLRASPLIAEAVVLGDGMDACVALVIPDFAALQREFGEHSDAEFVALPEAQKAIKAEIDRINKTLAGYEMVKRHALLTTPFTIDSGELTPTLKVKRKVVLEKHAELVRSLA